VAALILAVAGCTSAAAPSSSGSSPAPNALKVVAIVVSLQAVGIILVVAMLVTPAATGQLLTVRFGSLVLLAVAIGVGSSLIGLYISYWLDVATGATIVLVQTGLFLAALVLGPRTGLLGRRRPALAPAESATAS
jgi:hypothetical protein